MSYSSLSSDPLSSEDEDEKPLATVRNEPPQKSPVRGRNGKGIKGGGKTRGKALPRGAGKGKSMASMKSKAQTAPAHIPPPTDEERAEMERPATNGTNGQDIAVKVEDKMDEGQLSRLVTGVTVDAGGGATSATVRWPCIFVRLQHSSWMTHSLG